MQASVVLDEPGNVAFTNLDTISGRIVVRCSKSADVDSIIAKLEGESRTRLWAATRPNGETPKPQFEYHKILYRLQCVFPPPEVVESSNRTPGKSSYTLPPGTHEYPFSFKIPFNNSCWSAQPQAAVMKISTEGLEVSKPPPDHLKRALPPTLSGFPGEAEIRYFIKATVSRRAFWKENPRTFTPFTFFPIEPPRPVSSNTEIYARQRHTFNASVGPNGTKSKMKGLFGTKASSGTSGPPSITVDARLPEPSILTCNETIPLRLIVKKVNASNDMIYLNSLQVSLLGSTSVRAHDVFRTEKSSWIIVSKSNMRIALGKASDPADTEIVIDDQMWREQRLPNTVAPSFQICNIERSYQLDIRIGLSSSGSLQNASKGQSIVLPLRLDTKVYSGIAPPSELLEAMAATAVNGVRKPSASANDPLSQKLRNEQRRESAPSSSNTPGKHVPPPEASQASYAEQTPQYGDAPPSYEDAIASDLPPVDAPRPNYAPPPSGEDDALLNDEKGRQWSR